MILPQVIDEYLFCFECRKLSHKTVENYSKQIRYSQEHLKPEDVMAKKCHLSVGQLCDPKRLTINP